MIKTFTTKNNENNRIKITHLSAEEADFYASITSKLNEINRNPSDEVIEKILKFAKQR